VDDVFPRVVLTEGTVTEVTADVLRKSKVLQAAIQRNEVGVVQRVDKKAGKKPVSAAKLPPPEWAEVHTLLVDIADRTPANDETNDLLRQILGALEGLNTRIDNLPRTAPAPVYIQGNGPAPVRPTTPDAPAFIPAKIRSDSVKSANIKVEESTDEAGLGDAEAALRNLMRGK
jgi:hypothetical protein